MEEINLKELFDYIKERILIIVIIMLAVLVVGCVYSIFVKTPMYKSEAKLVLVSDDGLSSGNASYSQSDLTLNKNLVSTYSEIAVSRGIMDKVIKNLALNYTIEELQNRVTVTNVKETEIIKIQVVDPDKGLAADIANEIVKVFGEEIKNIYKLQNVATVDEADESDVPYNINVVKDIVIYIIVGTVLALGSVFVVFYFDTTIKSPEEVENKLELPVLGVIPKVTSRDKK